MSFRICRRERAKTVKVDQSLSVIQSGIHSFCHCLIHALIHPFMRSFSHSFFIYSLIHSFTQSFIHSFTHLLTHSLTRSYMFDQLSQHSCHSMTHLIPTTPLMRSTFLGPLILCSQARHRWYHIVEGTGLVSSSFIMFRLVSLKFH